MLARGESANSKVETLTGNELYFAISRICTISTFFEKFRNIF